MACPTLKSGIGIRRLNNALAAGPHQAAGGAWAGGGGAELGSAPAAVEQAAHVGLGPAERLQGRYPLQRLPAGNVEDHRVPGGGSDRLRVLLQAAAAEVGPGVFRRGGD